MMVFFFVLFQLLNSLKKICRLYPFFNKNLILGFLYIILCIRNPYTPVSSVRLIVLIVRFNMVSYCYDILTFIIRCVYPAIS